MNPIDDAMLDQDLNPRNPTRKPARHHRHCVVTFACLLPMVGHGCGLGDGASCCGASVEIIQGKDSAGATIDAVPGTGEAEIISDKDGHVEFTIDFPGGAAITYRGRRASTGALDDVTLSGTWHQHPGGIFGADFGTWEAPSPPDEGP